MTPWTQRWCWHCGRAFWAQRIDTVFCTPNCRMRAWRAVAMLRGTHGQVNGQFKRLPT